MIGRPVFPGQTPVIAPPQTVGPNRPFRHINRYIDQILSPTAGGGGGIEFPFQLQDTSVGGGSPVPQINVRYGTLQDVAPTNVGTDIVVSSGTNYFYLDLEVDVDGVIVSATLTNDTSPQPSDGDYHGYILLGEADSDGSVVTDIRQAATHSLRFSMCNRIVSEGELLAPGSYEFWGF
jgi:hypothetical protein